VQWIGVCHRQDPPCQHALRAFAPWRGRAPDSFLAQHVGEAAPRRLGRYGSMASGSWPHNVLCLRRTGHGRCEGPSSCGRRVAGVGTLGVRAPAAVGLLSHPWRPRTRGGPPRGMAGAVWQGPAWSGGYSSFPANRRRRIGLKQGVKRPQRVAEVQMRFPASRADRAHSPFRPSARSRIVKSRRRQSKHVDQVSVAARNSRGRPVSKVRGLTALPTGHSITARALQAGPAYSSRVSRARVRAPNQPFT